MPSALHFPSYTPVGMVVLYDSTLSADAASFDVQNIPATYRHLKVVLSGRTDHASQAFDYVQARFNNDSGSNYNSEWSQTYSTTGGSLESIGATSFTYFAWMPGATATASYAYGSDIDIPDYASTTFFKTFVGRGAGSIGTGTTNTRLIATGGMWLSAAAINRITISPGSGNFKAGTRLTIYGLGGAVVAEVAGIDGWTADPATWTYASATTFTVPGDVTAKFSKGTRIKLTQTTVKYFVVTASSVASGTTTVTITGGSDYTFANATVTSPYYSYATNPQGYPTWFNYSPTWTGFSANPSGPITRFAVFGSACHLTILCGTGGTSNATTLTVTLPITAGTLGYGRYAFRAQDNGAFPAGPGMATIDATGTLTAYKDFGASAWTASGAKGIGGFFAYEF